MSERLFKLLADDIRVWNVYGLAEAIGDTLDKMTFGDHSVLRVKANVIDPVTLRKAAVGVCGELRAADRGCELLTRTMPTHHAAGSCWQ